ncbi:MAG: hypothetical protein J0J15_24315, partial [Mesorhizobium sp.]|nr:hypothetical protein [Mesorhizobium sp.]
MIEVAMRLAALALLIITSVIQLVVANSWANFHLHWAALALGPDRLSLDFLIDRLVPSQTAWHNMMSACSAERHVELRAARIIAASARRGAD